EDGGIPNGKGLSGGIVIDVVKGSGPYNEQLSFSFISGSSDQNTITINGNGETIQTESEYYAIRFHGAKNMSLSNLRIVNLSYTSGRNVQFSNEAEYITISECELYQPNTVEYEDFGSYIAITNSTSKVDNILGVAAQNIAILNNTMHSRFGHGVLAGIYIGYPKHLQDHPNTIVGNTISNFYQFGIRMQAASKQVIASNEFFDNIAGSNVVEVIAINNEWHLPSIHVEGNSIHSIVTTIATSVKLISIRMNEVTESGSGIVVQNNVLDVQNVFGVLKGIEFYLDKSTFESNFVCSGNRFKLTTRESNSNVQGIYFYLEGMRKKGEIVLEGNEINLIGSGHATGIYCYGHEVHLPDTLKIINNIVSAIGNGYVTVLDFFCSTKFQFPVQVIFNTIVSQNLTNPNIKSQDILLCRLLLPEVQFENNVVFSDADAIEINVFHLGTIQNFYCNYNSIYIKNQSGRTGFVKVVGFVTFSDFYQNVSKGNDINIPPSFKDLEKGDYRPTEEYIVNRARPVSTIKTDIRGKLRDLKTPDMGALETDTFGNVGLEPLKVKIQVYPNPCSERLVIDLGQSFSGKAHIFNVLGEEVLRAELVLNQSLFVLDVQNLTPGMYVIIMQNGNHQMNAKFLVVE
ncbi:MAG: parallel beta-helix repeat protein, partial [Bacteroidia bacterium]